MTGPDDQILEGNPFATRWIRPGAISYLFPAGDSAELLVQRLQVSGWWGQIVGAHGTGKSCLLATLTAPLERVGRRPLLLELHDRQRRLPVDLKRMPGLDFLSLVIVDGYEQLSIWRRVQLKQYCRRRGMGLLVTAHGSVGLPTIYRTSTSPERMERIVERLLSGDWSRIRREEVARRLAAHHGNVREALFDLYDLYEQRRRVAPDSES